jgi:ATP adenylyltransferase
MDHLWSPWRYRYVSQAGKGEGCPFCEILKDDPANDRENLVLYRGKTNFIILNLYPYTTGHVLAMPYAHVPLLDAVSEESLAEMMQLARKLQIALKEVYRPEGFNMGMNLGKCAGAGVADHIHLHLLPRWGGDTNFMTVLAESRVQPEDLLTTYDKLAAHFPARTE